MREVLIDAYLDFVNDYLTVETYADHNGLTVAHAQALLDLAKSVYLSRHPDA